MALKPELLPRVVERLRALADENRLRILLVLRGGETNVTRLAEQLGVAQASVSKHLSVLKSVGIVQTRRQGTQTLCRIADESIFAMCEVVCDGVVRHVRRQQAEFASLAGDDA